MSLDNYDSVSERLTDNSTFLESFNKYAKIVNKLNSHDIELIGSIPNPEVADSKCGFKMIHNKITWDIFRVDDVVDMIVKARDSHKNRKE